MTSTQRTAAVNSLSKSTIKRLKTTVFIKKPGSKKKESKSKDKKTNDDKAAADEHNSGDASVNSTTVNKDEFEKKHNKTTERNHKDKWESREKKMLEKLKEAKLQKKTTEVQLQQIQLERKIQSARVHGGAPATGYEHFSGSGYNGERNMFKQSVVGNIDELTRKGDLECQDIEAFLHQLKPKHELVWDKNSGFNSPTTSNDAVCDVSTSQRHE